jgi:hypothetical protein
LSDSKVMDLKDFVKAALRDIVGAVAEAREEAKITGQPPVISPRLDSRSEGPGLSVSLHDGGGVAFLVDFDLAVTVVEGATLGAGVSAGISIVPFSVKGKADGSTSSQQTNTQRIKFSVPVRYPQTGKMISQPSVSARPSRPRI